MNSIPIYENEFGSIGTLQAWADHYKIDESTARYRWEHWGTFEKGKQFIEHKLFFYGLAPNKCMAKKKPKRSAALSSALPLR